MSTVNERVERGAALLDARRPGWWLEIDLGRLDIYSGCNCVLGQLGGYLAGLDDLGIRYDLDSDVSHGFDGETRDEDVFLTEAWRDLIQQRSLALVSA